MIVASEFSRDMMIEGVPGSTAKDQSRAVTDTLQEMRHYGLHRHFTGGSSVLLFGGGVKRGFLYGATADERPCVAIENPVSVTDLHRHDSTPRWASRRRRRSTSRSGRSTPREDGKGQVDRRAVRVIEWLANHCEICI